MERRESLSKRKRGVITTPVANKAGSNTSALRKIWVFQQMFAVTLKQTNCNRLIKEMYIDVLYIPYQAIVCKHVQGS